MVQHLSALGTWNPCIKDMYKDDKLDEGGELNTYFVRQSTKYV
jgi:hypothetical protein